MSDDFIEAVRVGNMSAVKRHIADGRDVNERDRWDATPIYYAALCGYIDMVKLLLENGARAEPGTVDGERVWYASLNLNVRTTLQSYKYAPPRLDLYSNFLAESFNNPAASSDAVLKSRDKHFHTHRFMLKTQSPFFARELTRRFKGASVIPVKSKLVSWQAVLALLTYIYTRSARVDEQFAEDLARLAKQCGLDDLHAQIRREMKVLSMEVLFLDKLHCGELNRVIKVNAPSGNPTRHIQDNIHAAVSQVFSSPLVLNSPALLSSGADAFDAVPDAQRKELQTWCDEWFFDTVLSCPVSVASGEEQAEGLPALALFPAHRFFLTGRSEYFEALFSGSFLESERLRSLATRGSGTGAGRESRPSLPLIHLANIDARTLSSVLLFMYTDLLPAAKHLGDQELVNLMDAGAVLLLPGLRSRVDAALQERISVENVCDLLEVAEIYTSDKLRAQCLVFMARNLAEVSRTEGYRELASRLGPGWAEVETEIQTSLERQAWK